MHRSNEYYVVSTPVLDYRTPPPPRTRARKILDTPAQVIGACGGIDSFLFYLSLCFLCLGFFGMIPCLTLWWILIDRWSKRSRWF
jgi:hypothetical protein